MQKFIMFSDVPENAQVMYPDGTIKTKDEVKQDYPILNTPLGVIGCTTDESGAIDELVCMGYYDNYNSFKQTYVAQGVELTDDMTKAQVCDAITTFVNTPQASEEQLATEAYLNM